MSAHRKAYQHKLLVKSRLYLETDPNRYFFLTGRFTEELKRYLKAYCLKNEGFKIKEIIPEIRKNTTEEDCKNIDIQRTVRSDIAAAKKIIKNVELGYFPGKFR